MQVAASHGRAFRIRVWEAGLADAQSIQAAARWHRANCAERSRSASPALERALPSRSRCIWQGTPRCLDSLLSMAGRSRGSPSSSSPTHLQQSAHGRNRAWHHRAKQDADPCWRAFAPPPTPRSWVRSQALARSGSRVSCAGEAGHTSFQSVMRIMHWVSSPAVPYLDRLITQEPRKPARRTITKQDHVVGFGLPAFHARRADRHTGDGKTAAGWLLRKET